MQPLAYLAARPEDYARLGIGKSGIALWEDGIRTSGGKGTYEWWYFDVHLSDGSKLVIIFYTKDFTDLNKPLSPMITFNLDRPNAPKLSLVYTGRADGFMASQERCDVRIGPNRFAGDLHTYTIHVAIEDVVADITLVGTVPAWRPETGHIYFGAQAEQYFAWLPSVPQGNVTAVLTIGGETQQLTGVGYHDHNWGNAPIIKLINNWYWARGAVGDYTTIASFITAEQAYNYETNTIFMLAKQGKIVADNGALVRFSASDVFTDVLTAKPVANETRYEYVDGPQRYVVTFRRKETILQFKFIQQLSGLKRLAAQIIGFSGAYLRFTGEITLERYEADTLRETHTEEGIWELMYFGKPKGT